MHAHRLKRLFRISENAYSEWHICIGRGRVELVSGRRQTQPMNLRACAEKSVGIVCEADRMIVAQRFIAG